MTGDPSYTLKNANYATLKATVEELCLRTGTILAYMLPVWAKLATCGLDRMDLPTSGRRRYTDGSSSRNDLLVLERSPYSFAT